MTEQWYYAQQGQQKGPVSEEQIRQLMSSGQLQPTDVVWKQGLSEWNQISQVFPPPPPDPNTPPPIPTQAAQFGSKAKEVAASLVSRGKAAAHLVAKQVERTKITTINLPSSYQALGKHIYKSGNHRNDLASIFQQIDGFLSEIKAIQARSAAQSNAEGIADKAVAAAKATKDAAETKMLQTKANHAAGQLGKVAFETYGEQSGPPELIRPISDLLARVAELDGELSKLQGSVLSKQAGTFWNSNRENPLFIGALVVLFFPVGLFLVWRHSVWTSKTKWIWTGAFAMVAIGMIGSRAGRIAGGGGGSRLTAMKLSREYLTEANAADKKYKGKIVEVIGTRRLGGAQPDKERGTVHYEVLRSRSDAEIRCLFVDESEVDKIYDAETKQGLIIQGKCQGLDTNGYVVIADCKFIGLAPSGGFKKPFVGTREEFIDQLIDMGAQTGHHLQEKEFGNAETLQLLISFEVPTWTEYFGEPTNIHERYDSFAKCTYHMWSIHCTDGTLEIVGDFLTQLNRVDVRKIVFR